MDCNVNNFIYIFIYKYLKILIKISDPQEPEESIGN